MRNTKEGRGQSTPSSSNACRATESDLANKLAAAKAADLAAAKQAELQLAKQQWEAERAKGIPIEQDIQRYHKAVQEKVGKMLVCSRTWKAGG